MNSNPVGFGKNGDDFFSGAAPSIPALRDRTVMNQIGLPYLLGTILADRVNIGK
jgi:hypothetical protein